MVKKKNGTMCHFIGKLKIATSHLEPQNQNKSFFQ